MSTVQRILDEAGKLFDAAGIVPLDGESILIVGLSTSPERDLDDFYRDENGAFVIRGFETHVRLKLDSLVAIIRGLGLSAEVFGPCGYPQGNEMNLKRLAVAAGLGSWGKNSMVLHPRCGPRLRLASIRISGTALDCTGPGLDGFAQNEQCRDCNACIDACPLSIIEPYYMRDRLACLANTSHFPEPGVIECCDFCWTICPAGAS